MINMVVQLIFFVGIVLLLARPLGKYIAKVAQGEVVFLSRVLKPIEKACYRLLG